LSHPSCGRILGKPSAGTHALWSTNWDGLWSLPLVSLLVLSLKSAIPDENKLPGIQHLSQWVETSLLIGFPNLLSILTVIFNWTWILGYRKPNTLPFKSIWAAPNDQNSVECKTHSLRCLLSWSHNDPGFNPGYYCR
jgi:hypothetical protein